MNTIQNVVYLNYNQSSCTVSFIKAFHTAQRFGIFYLMKTIKKKKIKVMKSIILVSVLIPRDVTGTKSKNSNNTQILRYAVDYIDTVYLILIYRFLCCNVYYFD